MFTTSSYYRPKLRARFIFRNIIYFCAFPALSSKISTLIPAKDGQVIHCITILRILNLRRVEHNTDRGTEGLGRQVGGELGLDNTVGTVRVTDATPDSAVLGTVLLGLGLVDVDDTLTTVEGSVLLVLDVLQLDQNLVRLEVALRAAEKRQISAFANDKP